MGLLDTIKSLLGLGGDAQPAEQPQAPQQQQAAAAPEPEAAEEESSSDDDDGGNGEGRDYDLEAKDDSASFDFKNDLEGYYAAEFQIEQAWEDEGKRAPLFQKFGIRNVQHFYQVKATLERYIQSPHAQQKYGGVGEIMHVKMKATQAIMMGQMASQVDPKEFEPFEGVSLEQWAGAMAGVAGGKNIDDLMKGLGCDKVKWDRVSAEWNARMSRDTSATIARVYGEAFTKNAGGQFAGAGAGGGDPPIPLEKYVEIMEAQSAGAKQGKDASQILQSFGLSVLDWSNVGGWWSKHISENAMKQDSKLLKEYDALQKKYQAKYAVQSADSDIKF